MDKMIQALSRAQNQCERRAILQRRARQCPRLLELPEYSEFTDPFDPRQVRTDYVLFTATMSFQELEAMLLFRMSYTCEYGFSPDYDNNEPRILGHVATLQLAATTYSGAPPFWERVSFSLLSDEMHEALDNVMLEHERSKSAAEPSSN